MSSDKSFKDIVDAYENLTVEIHEISIRQIKSIKKSNIPQDTSFSNVYESLLFSQTGNDLSMTGEIILYLKNQNNLDNKTLSLDIRISVQAINEIDRPNVFAKTLNYIFNWTKKYINSENIKGFDDEKFIMPDFKYGSSHFLDQFL